MLTIVIAAAVLAVASGGATLWRVWDAVPERNDDLVLF